MGITFNLYRNADGSLDGRYKLGDKPFVPTARTLTGSGFGAVTNTKPSAYDKFDEYIGVGHGDEIPRNSANPNWVETFNTAFPDSNIPYTLDAVTTLGSRSYSIQAGGEAKRSALDVPTIRPEGAPVDPDKIYVSWYIRFNESLDVPPQTSGGSAKLLRVWDDANGDPAKMRMSWHTKSQGYSSNSIPMSPSPDETIWDTPNVWRRCEVYIDQNIGHTLWVDGKKLGELPISSGEVCHKSGTTPDPFFVQTIGHDIRFTASDPTPDHTVTLKHWLADFFQYPTRARVELSNSPTLDDSVFQKRVLQEVSSWTDTEIVIPELFLGELDQGQTIYAHIIKDDGSVINYGDIGL